MLKLKLQYFGHLMIMGNSLGKSTVLGNIEGNKRRGHQRMRRLDGITENEHELGQTLGDGEGHSWTNGGSSTDLYILSCVE